MKKNLELKFNMEDWITILKQIRLEPTNPDLDFSPSYKKEVIARNEEKEIFTDFFSGLKKKREEHKDAIRDAKIHWKPHPFPELIDVPQTKNGLVAKTIYNWLENIAQKELYSTLLEVNGRPNYQEIVRRISSESRRDNVVIDLDYEKNEDSLLNIFKSAIALCPPAQVQEAFEYFAKEYNQLDKIDSKQETKDKENEILSGFHKDMRQCDMFGTGEADSIIYNLWHVTDVPIRAMIAVTKYIKNESKQTV